MESSIESFCRVCLQKPDGETTNIHKMQFEPQLTAARMIELVAHIEIEANSMPSEICSYCWADLQVAYNIQVVCQASDRKLKESTSLKGDNLKSKEVTPQALNVNNDDSENVTRNYILQIETRDTKDICWKQLKQQSFTCDVCGKNFKKSQNLRTHSNLHGEKKFECRVCSKKFATKQYLQSHERTHTKERPFACNLCDKKYSFQIDLYRHKMGSHMNTFSCFCDHCGKGFTKKSNLVIHLRLHTGERPYFCDKCGKTFAQPAAYKKHLEIHDRNSQ